MCLIREERRNNQIIYDLKSFDFGSIKELSFRNCMISSLEKGCFKIDFENLELLEIGSTCISRIESNAFEYLNKLKLLILSENQIEQIETNGFQGLDNLEELNLDGNKLTKIELNSFQHLNKLKKLDLRFNKIEQNDLDEFNIFKNLIWSYG